MKKSACKITVKNTVNKRSDSLSLSDNAVTIPIKDLVEIARANFRNGGVRPKNVKDSSVSNQIDRVAMARQSARKLLEVL